MLLRFQTQYLFGALCAVPFIPTMYLQGKRIYREMPKLPDALDTEGCCGKGERAIRLLAVGESSISGVGVERHNESIVGHLAGYLADSENACVDYQVVAKSGYDAVKVHDELLPQLPAGQPDFILLGLGGNDAFQANSPRHFLRHARRVIDRLRATYPEVPIVMLTVPPIYDFIGFTSLLRFFLGGLAKLFGRCLHYLTAQYDRLHYFDDELTLAKFQRLVGRPSEPVEFFADGVHPTALTYQIWAEQLGHFVRRRVL